MRQSTKCTPGLNLDLTVDGSCKFVVEGIVRWAFLNTISVHHDSWPCEADQNSCCASSHLSTRDVNTQRVNLASWVLDVSSSRAAQQNPKKTKSRVSRSSKHPFCIPCVSYGNSFETAQVNSPHNQILERAAQESSRNVPYMVTEDYMCL